MEVESVVARLCVLILASSSAAAVAIRHNGNFGSGLELRCTDGPFTLDSGVSFQKNGVDIQVNGGGTLSFPLTQENEGAFTCTHDGQTSDPITLAAEPPLDFPLSPRTHYMFVPVSGTVPTELNCDIGPGAARESYNIRWNRLYYYGGFSRIDEGISQETFGLILPVNASSNSTVYRCVVTIDHDGNQSPAFYDGASITIRTAVEPPLDFLQQRSHYVLVPMSNTVSTQLSCDIGPAEARVVQWNQLNSDGNFTPITEGISQENFNLTLPVNINSNGNVYRCSVIIDFGGNRRSYNGASITLRIAGEGEEKETPLATDVSSSTMYSSISYTVSANGGDGAKKDSSLAIGVGVVGVVVVVVVVQLVIIITMTMVIRKTCKVTKKCKQSKETPVYDYVTYQPPAQPELIQLEENMAYESTHPNIAVSTPNVQPNIAYGAVLH